MLATVSGYCCISGCVRIRSTVVVSGGISEASDWGLVSCSRATQPSNHSSGSTHISFLHIMNHSNLLESLSYHSSSLGTYAVRRHMF